MYGLKNLLKQSVALTIANMKSRYRRTFAGFIWVIMNPILVFLIQNFVFRNILNIKIDHYVLFLLGGLLPWIFISQTLDMVTPVLVNSANLFKSMTIHPLVIINAQILDNFINYLFAFLIVLFFSATNCYQLFHELFALIIPMLLLFLGTFLVSWLLAILHVFYRDTRFVVTVLLNLLFFLTPIFYPISLIPSGVRWIVLFNPIYSLIEPVREAIYQYQFSDLFTSCLKSLIFSIVFLILAICVWKKVKNELYFKL